MLAGHPFLLTFPEMFHVEQWESLGNLNPRVVIRFGMTRHALEI